VRPHACRTCRLHGETRTFLANRWSLIGLAAILSLVPAIRGPAIGPEDLRLAAHGKEGAFVSVNDWHRDNQALHVGLRLIRRRLVQYVVHVASTVLGYARYSLFLILALVALALARFGRHDPALSTGLWLGQLWLANLGLTCMIEVPQSRYTLYTDSTLFAWMVAAIAGPTSTDRRVEA
jgi:hypothetical protein